MLGQTVPSTSSSNGVRFAHWQWTSDSQRQRSGVEVSPVLEIITGAHSSSARYDTNFKYTRTACLLYWILSGGVSQYRLQMLKERSDVIIPWRREHEPRSRVHRRLQLLIAEAVLYPVMSMWIIITNSKYVETIAFVIIQTRLFPHILSSVYFLIISKQWFR